VSPGGKVVRGLLLVPRCAGEGGELRCVKASSGEGGALWPVVLWEVVMVLVLGKVVGIVLRVGSAWGDG
jgi:hypothetical protein